MKIHAHEWRRFSSNNTNAFVVTRIVAFSPGTLVQQEQRLMRHIFVCCLLFCCLNPGPFAQTRNESQPPASPPSIDSEYRRLDESASMLRARNAHTYAITAPNGIDDAAYVEIGGIEQWITIRGEDRNNPVLLFLHGGPGDATNPWGYAGFRNWLKYFTVVQWDQRGAGRTFGRNGAAAASTITIERMVRDGVELAELMSKKLQKDKIVLVGHSWGSTLGVFMAKARPELFYAFVGTGQVVDPTRNYAVAHTALVERASREGNSRALQELNEVGPPPWRDGKGFAVQRRWSNLFEGGDVFIASMVGFALTAPGYSLGDFNDWFE